MAPAERAGAPGAARRRRWTRDEIIEAINEWVALYGEPPRAADWNPAAARWAKTPWRIERYRRGRPDGTPWPSLNSAKRPFGGSLAAAGEAAGHLRRRPARRVPPATASGSPDPAALASALRLLARARRDGDPVALRRALTAVSDAAVRWRDRV